MIEDCFYCLIGYIVAGLMFIALNVKHDKLKAEQEKVTQLQQEINNLKDPDYVNKEKKLLEAKIKSLNNINQYESIRVDRIALSNLIKGFKHHSIWLKIKDLTDLEITDGVSTVTLKCTPDNKHSIT